MKSLLLSLIIVGTMSQSVKLSPLQVYQGLVLGFYEEGGGCTTNLKGSLHDLSESLEQYVKYDDLDEARRLFSMSLYLLQDSIKTCYVGIGKINKLSSDIDKVSQLASDPVKFTQHIVKDLFVNQKDLMSEFKQLKIHYKNKNSQQLGYHFGKVLYQVLVGVRI